MQQKTMPFLPFILSEEQTKHILLQQNREENKIKEDLYRSTCLDESYAMNTTAWD